MGRTIQRRRVDSEWRRPRPGVSLSTVDLSAYVTGNTIVGGLLLALALAWLFGF